tara:strand:+ start:2857 stop:3507 length:651 start_codon:yes stop_codon:yes gene_type:complete
MINILILDYGICNIKSIQRGLDKVGAKVTISNDPKKIMTADKLVLPGVGAFGTGMNNLKSTNVIEYINEYRQSGKEILGICLGMQMLLSQSFENGTFRGLDYISGNVSKISSDKENGNIRKIPSIGWNSLIISNDKNELNKGILNNIKKDDYFYFVHSYMASEMNSNNLKAYYKYDNLDIPAVIQNENTIGLQFHPEKSANSGLKLLENFVSKDCI